MYCFILPICLSTCPDQLNENNQTIEQKSTQKEVSAERKANELNLFFSNLLSYLSLMLPGTYFYGGWFWYAETAFGKSFFSGTVENEVYAKLITVLIILIAFTILAQQTISNIERTNWCIYLWQTVIQFMGFFVLTLVLSIGIIYIVHYRNPISIDQHEWIITNSGLSVLIKMS